METTLNSNLTFDIFEKVQDAVAVVGNSGQVIYANNSFFSIFDLPVGGVKKAKSILEFLTFENLDVPLEKIFETATVPPHYMETNFSTKYGKKGIIQLAFHLLAGKENNFILFFRDVSLEARLQSKYLAELVEKDKKIHEISLLRDVAALLVGLTDENSICLRILEKSMTVGNHDAALFLKSSGTGKTRRLFVIDRKNSIDGNSLDIPFSQDVESFFKKDWEVEKPADYQKQIQKAFVDWYDLNHYDISTIVPVGGKDAKLGLLLLFKQQADKSPTSAENISLLKSVVAQMAVALEGAQYFENSIVDSMTKLFNKGYFESRFATEVGRARRESTELTLLICDIDHFKKVNDTYGHAVGDLVLKNVAQFIKSTCRTTDLACRYGGEEFCIILPETKAPGAIIFAERLRKIVEAGSVKHNNEDLKVTISLGMAMFPAHGLSEKDIFAHADEALYESKSKGRNRWTIYHF
jgi:diguanylate cyclase (GGDEF)-like protein/PAS domain S-box-containing protein